MKKVLFLLAAVLPAISCNDNPVKPKNNNPVIFSVIVFPEIVNPRDSLIMVCNAADPDGETVVYDWYASGIIRIKGARPGDPAVFNNYDNFQVFYAPDSQYVSTPLDTFSIECAVRDGIGGMDVTQAYFMVRKEF